MIIKGVQGVRKKDKEEYLNYNQIYNVYRGLPGVPEGGFDTYRKAVVKHLKEKFGLKDYVAGEVKMIKISLFLSLMKSTVVRSRRFLESYFTLLIQTIEELKEQ